MIIDMEQAKSRKINGEQAFNPLREVQKVVKWNIATYEGLDSY